MKKVITAGAAIVLALALASPAAAFADEVEAPVSAPLATEQEAVAPEAPAPASEPAEEATAPEEVAPVAEVSTLTERPSKVTEWHTWAVGEVLDTPPVDASDVSWPQTYVGAGQVAPTQCGVWYQQDQYKGTRAEIDAILADSTLTYGEDFDVIETWKFVYGGDCPPPVTNTQCEATPGPVGTNLNGLWGNVDTRSAGHYEYTESGLHVWTDDASSNAKVSLDTAASFALKDTGTLDIGWTGSTPPPGVNLYVTFAPGVTGTLVYESVYGQDLWLTNGSSQAAKDNAPVNGGGNGSQWHGTIDQWLTKYPAAQVTGLAFSLGSGVLGDGVISSVTAGCQVFTFDYEREVPVQPEPLNDIVYESNEPVCVEPLDGTATVEVYATPWTQDYVFDSEAWEWVLGEKVFGERVFDHAETVPAEEECAVVVTPTPTPTPTPTSTPTASPTGLAATGGDSTMPWLAGGLIALLIGAASMTISVARRR